MLSSWWCCSPPRRSPWRPRARPRPRCRCPCCSARSCCPPAAAAAKSRGRGASPSPARACGWPLPACPAAPRCATSPASSDPSRPLSPPRPQGWPPPPSAGIMNLLQKNDGSFRWWFFRSLGQLHTFLFFSCETLSPNPKLDQILRPDFFLLEQRIVSTGEKFYSKYLFLRVRLWYT